MAEDLGALKSPISIRPARSEEAAGLSALAMESKASWGYSDAFMAACRDELMVTADDLSCASSAYFVAEDQHGIAGYYGLVDEQDMELEALFVSPTRMRQGIGQALIGHAKTEASRRGRHRIVIQGDPNAEAFYLAVGATRIGVRPSDSIAGRHLPLFELRCAPEDRPGA